MNYLTKSDLSVGPQFGSQLSQYAAVYAVSRRTGLTICFLKEYMDVFRKVKLFEAFDLKDPIFAASDMQFSSTNDKNVSVDRNWDILGDLGLYTQWHEYRNDLLQVFKFRPHIQEIAKANLDIVRVKETYPVVALHVRRGDYLQVSSLNLELSYYEQAVSYFTGSYFKLLVFSDDIDWCRKYILGDNVFYSDGNSNYVDMCMMTMCDHNIIANSTFSWWGAYLNRGNGKVICPQRYIGESDRTNQYINGNYYPPEWISLNN